MPSRIDNYLCTTKLGAGATATVRRARNLTTGQEVALKILDRSKIENDAMAIKFLQAELTVLQKITHPNMVRLHEFKEDAVLVKSNGTKLRVAYMALELLEGGELFDYVALKHFDQPTCRYIFNQLLKPL